MLGILFLSIFILFIYLVIRNNNNNDQQRNFSLIKVNLPGAVILDLPQVECDTFNAGAKGNRFHFSSCDLLLIKDAIIILSCSLRNVFKQLIQPIILTKEVAKYNQVFPFAFAVNPNKLNLNSFNKEIYIEFEVRELITTYIEIRLKGISEENKEKIADIQLCK
jgi:hypothetical protein